MGLVLQQPTNFEFKIMGVAPISGFPEHLPADCLAEQALIEHIKRQYELFGFSPIETCAVERMDVLQAKGNMGRQVYGLNRAAEDDMATDLGLHFDLTVPLARYVVQNSGQLVFPFRRYQIQKVWRGERSQAGRFKEFYQCDIDIVGRENLPEIHDAEFPAIIYNIFSTLNLPAPVIHISDRRIWDGFTQKFALQSDQIQSLLGTLDKTHKIGVEKVQAELLKNGFTAECVTAAMEFLACQSVEAGEAVLAKHEIQSTGLPKLQQTMENAIRFGCPASALKPDFSIARGLDYYTGTVFETFVEGKLHWGSVCSGGRYDDLAGAFGKQKYPGVGVSIGLSRLFARLREENVIQPTAMTPALVLVTMLDSRNFFEQYLEVARQLRSAGVPTEVYLGKKGLGDQIGYASKKGIPFALIAGETEFQNGQFKLKDLRAQQEEVILLQEAIERLKSQMTQRTTRFVRARE